MQPRRVRESDTVRLNELEAKLSSVESKLDVKSNVKTLIPHAYFMNSYVDGIFGKYVITINGNIKKGIVVCELNEGKEVPKISISIGDRKESSRIDLNLVVGSNEITLLTAIRVKMGDVIVIESSTPERIKSLALSFNIET